MDVLACGAGGCLPGASGGGASLVPVVEVPPWCRRAWIIQGGRGHIYGRHHGRSGRRRISAAAVSLVNRSCKGSLLDAIALIINYLYVPLGIAFTGEIFS